MKWYASYDSNSKSHRLYSEKQRAEVIESLRDSLGRDEMNEVENMHEFKTFREAKKFCLDGYRCDLQIIRQGLEDLKKERAK